MNGSNGQNGSSSEKKERSGISRREFLKKSGAISSLALTPAILNGHGRKPVKAGDARNVIFMVSDGMSSGTLTLADIVKRRQFGSPTNWISLYDSERRFYRGAMDMASQNSPVTDSAAASSAWGTGRRVNNGAVCMDPNGEKLKPILEIFRDAGKKTGLVTTTRITHATPAGFGSNVEVREMEDEIAAQYLEKEYDLLMGGGARHFEPDSRDDGRDLFAAYANNGYRVVKQKDGLENAGKSEKLLGIFSRSHMPFTIDHENNPELQTKVPTLREMTETALNKLSTHPDGFILQVEGGRVDHGGHDNDAPALVYDQIAFDEALGVVLDFVDRRDDTLVIITTDHGTANPGLNGMGHRYTGSGAKLEHLFKFTNSTNWILSELSENSNISMIRERVYEAASLEITAGEAEMVKNSLSDSFQAPYHMENKPKSVLGAVLANYIGINWLGTAHTSDYVELAAIGPGIDRLDRFVRNTELFDLMVETAGVQKYAGVEY